MSGKYILSLFLMALLFHLAQQSPVNETESTPDYSGCGTEFQCFGINSDKGKEDCVVKKSCIVLLKTQPIQSGAKFGLYWQRDAKSGDKWVAAGLSTDAKMGDDSVTECIVQSDNKVISQQGLTFDKNDTFGVNTVKVNGITVGKTSYSNGLLSCEWTRTEDTKVQTFDFNLKTNKYYILLAYGPIDNKGNILHHTSQAVSPNAVELEAKSPSTTTAKSASTTAKSGSTTSKSTGTTSKSTGTTSKSTGTTSKSTGTTSKSTGTTSKSTGTTQKSTGTTQKSTGTTQKSTGTTQKSTGTTQKSTGTTNEPPTTKHNNSNSITLSLFTVILMSILLVLNN